ncbi:MAG: alginate export family protein, partial [Leptospiraceae bacterium]|nr:alginate export family protein [Leptospiraceae bacterium]
RSNSADFVGQKLQIAFTKETESGMIFKATLQDARIWGGQTNSSIALDTGAEQASTDVREAYLLIPDAGIESFDVKLGRQIFNYGDQRLLGSLDWTNIGRSFDAAWFSHTVENTNILDGWISVISEGNAKDIVNASQNQNKGDLVFYGVYDQLSLGQKTGLDLYYLGKLSVDNNSQKIHTGGLRFWHRPETGLDFTLETAAQTGKLNGLNLQSYAGTVQTGFSFVAGMKMRLGVETNYASGDESNTDNKAQTFQNLFHTNHIHYGQADLISWQNMMGANLSYKIWILKNLTVTTTGHSYWRAQTSDSWYFVAGGTATSDAYITSAAGNRSGKRHLFYEGDLTISYKHSANLNFQAGLSYIARGDAALDAGKSTDASFFYFFTEGRI